jgi:hypothetical protein
MVEHIQVGAYLPDLLAGSYAQRFDVKKSRLLHILLEQSIQLDRLLALSNIEENTLFKTDSQTSKLDDLMYLLVCFKVLRGHWRELKVDFQETLVRS